MLFLSPHAQKYELANNKSEKSQHSVQCGQLFINYSTSDLRYNAAKQKRKINKTSFGKQQHGK